MFKKSKIYIAYSLNTKTTRGFGSLMLDCSRKIKNWDDITDLKEAIKEYNKDNKLYECIEDIVILNWKII